MVENNRFVGAPEGEGHIIHDIPIPEANILPFDKLPNESMDHLESIRINGRLLPEYTKTKWLTNITKARKELVPDDIQLKSLVSNPDDILIAHKPGEGKTANAILLAEMRKGILLLKMVKRLQNSVIAPGAPILVQWQQQVIKWGLTLVIGYSKHTRISTCLNQLPITHHGKI